MKQKTLVVYDYAKSWFFEYFDENELVENLSNDSMTQWKNLLLKELATASVATVIKQTKTCFLWAVKQDLIPKSPLEGIAPGNFRNKSKDRLISMKEYYRLLDACPCQDWRVIIALARIGGLRCPSEVITLRWSDVKWEKNCFHVRSPKTEHHEGKESRVVPLFPELKSELETLFFVPESQGKEFVITRYRDVDQGLAAPFATITKRAGLSEIPSPFINMRRTRSNEVRKRWGAALESEWIGHSEQTANDHYLVIEDSEYAEASQWNVSESIGNSMDSRKTKRTPKKRV